MRLMINIVNRMIELGYNKSVIEDIMLDVASYRLHPSALFELLKMFEDKEATFKQIEIVRNNAHQYDLAYIVCLKLRGGQ